jgi:hypothetical protein
MNVMRAATISYIAFSVSGFLAGTASARADDCALVLDASIARAKSPHSITHVTTIPGKGATRAEMIFLADKAYVQTNGGWRSMPYSPQEQIDRVNAASKRVEQTTHSCEKLGSEPINGEPVSLLIMHSEVNGKTSETRFWISEKTGLPLKSEAHLSNGTVLADDFRYSNVEAPPGVK